MDVAGNIVDVANAMFSGVLPEVNRAIAIGYGANADNNCIAIGTNVYAKDNTIQIGDSSMKVFIGGYCISDRLELLEQTVAEQNKIIHALWYAPGMPGSTEASEMFNSDMTELGSLKKAEKKISKAEAEAKEE